MERKSFFKSLLPFLPLLGFYIILVLAFPSDVLSGDENRYIRYATNLTQGFFTDGNNPDLRNGPGYPLVLMPFVALNTDFIIPRLLNVLFVLVGVYFFYKTLRLYTKKRYAMIFTYVIGLYPPLCRWMILLYSEALAFMLISGFIYHFCQLHHQENLTWKNLSLTAFFLGFLVLTKVIFFQVILVSILILSGSLILRKARITQRAFLALVGAFIFISPYLFYAYFLTGKLFYLSTGGGEVLYHRSTPYENEWGNWFSADNVLNGGKVQNGQSKVYEDLSTLSANHRDIYLQLESLSHMDRDSALKAKALANMKEYPMKYLKNTVSNVGRLFFHYPISYRSQNLNAFGYMIPNIFIVVLFTLILYPAFLARKNIPFEIKAQLVFVLIYGGGMILLSGKGRYFMIMVPSLVLFLAYVCKNILKITLVKTEEVK